MATKKQKRQEALAKREKFEAEMRESGLQALQAERERRDRELRQAWQKQHDKKHHKFVDECPICGDIKKQQFAIRRAQSISKIPRPTMRSAS